MLQNSVGFYFRTTSSSKSSITRLSWTLALVIRVLQTIMAIAGHVSPRMLAHYSHIRMEAKRQALDALSSRPSQGATEGSQGGSYDTKNDTIQRLRELPDVQVVEKSGRREWIRTIDLYRVKVAL